MKNEKLPRRRAPGRQADPGGVADGSRRSRSAPPDTVLSSSSPTPEGSQKGAIRRLTLVECAVCAPSGQRREGFLLADCRATLDSKWRFEMRKPFPEGRRPGSLLSPAREGWVRSSPTSVLRAVGPTSCQNASLTYCLLPKDDAGGDAAQGRASLPRPDMTAAPGQTAGLTALPKELGRGIYPRPVGLG